MTAYSVLASNGWRVEWEEPPLIAERVAKWAAEKVNTLEAENAALRARIHEASEIYTGMDGFVPETAPEAYQQKILQQMFNALQGVG